MRKIFLIPILFFLLGNLPLFSQTTSASSDTLVWHTDMVKAYEQSKATNKPIFAFFTGSDWCGWCIRLQKNVFAKPAFVKWAQENVILVELDFPRRTQQAPELAQQNASLQQTFQVQGFPTVWLFYLSQLEGEHKFEISALGSLGYPGGAESGREEVTFIDNANKILANRVKK